MFPKQLQLSFAPPAPITLISECERLRLSKNQMLIELYNKFNLKHFDSTLPIIPIEWSMRMTTTAGRVTFNRCPSLTTTAGKEGRYQPTKLTMSYKLFESLNWDMAKIERTLIHEMVHVWRMWHFCDSGHSREFQLKMFKITGENINHRCHNYDTSKVTNHKWQFTCQKCGLVITKARKPRGLGYKHKKCGGSLLLSEIGGSND